MTDSSTSAPTLPGLMSDEEADALLGTFQRVEEARGVWVLDRMPTRDERTALMKRSETLQRALRPISVSMVERDKASAEITTLLLGFPSLQSGAGRGMIAAFTTHVMDLPLFAILQACRDIPSGRVMVRDRDGNDVRLTPDFPITSARLHEIASRYTQPLRQRQHEINLVMSAQRTMTPQMKPADRAKVQDGLEKLVKTMRMASAKPDPIESERARHKAERELRHQQRQDEVMLEEYERAGLRPVYAGGMLVSLDLAKRFDRERPVLKRKRKETDDVHA